MADAGILEKVVRPLLALAKFGLVELDMLVGDRGKDVRDTIDAGTLLVVGWNAPVISPGPNFSNSAARRIG